MFRVREEEMKGFGFWMTEMKNVEHALLCGSFVLFLSEKSKTPRGYLCHTTLSIWIEYGHQKLSVGCSWKGSNNNSGKQQATKSKIHDANQISKSKTESGRFMSLLNITNTIINQKWQFPSSCRVGSSNHHYAVCWWWFYMPCFWLRHFTNRRMHNWRFICR